jgi:hypothetical protein
MSATSTESVPRLRCERREHSGAVDADAQASRWQTCPVVILRDVVTGAPPGQGTEVRAIWSGDELRVLFIAADKEPWATFTERDAPLYQEEVVEVFIDPVGDGLSYFEFEVNPLNAVLDLVLRRNRSGLLKDFGWRCEGLRTAARVLPGGWTAELAIPFCSLVAEPPHAGALWRMNFCRIDRPRDRQRELSAWSPTGRASFHVPERFGEVEFVA